MANKILIYFCYYQIYHSNQKDFVFKTYRRTRFKNKFCFPNNLGLIKFFESIRNYLDATWMQTVSFFIACLLACLYLTMKNTQNMKFISPVHFFIIFNKYRLLKVQANRVVYFVVFFCLLLHLLQKKIFFNYNRTCGKNLHQLVLQLIMERNETFYAHNDFQKNSLKFNIRSCLLFETTKNPQIISMDPQEFVLIIKSFIK